MLIAVLIWVRFENAVLIFKGFYNKSISLIKNFYDKNFRYEGFSYFKRFRDKLGKIIRDYFK